MVNALVGDSFAKSWNVSLYRHTGDAGWREQFARVFAYLAFALSTMGLAIAVFGPELLSVMVPASFMPAALLLPILVLAYVLRDVADFFRSLLLINKRAVWVGNIALAAAVVNLLLNILLIPAYGTYGAAWATLLTWSAYLAVCWIVAHYEHGLPIRVVPYGRLLVVMVAVYAASAALRARGFLLQVFLDGMWVTLFVSIAALILRSETGSRTVAPWLGNLLARILVPEATKSPRSEPASRHILMLAYYFPPQNKIGAAHTASLDICAASARRSQSSAPSLRRQPSVEASWTVGYMFLCRHPAFAARCTTALNGCRSQRLSACLIARMRMRDAVSTS